MRQRTVGLLTSALALQLVAPAAADPRKVLVLPVEGTADAATRAKLTGLVVRLSRALDGQVTTAEATFSDTALAVGCEPRAASCRDEVLATLAVDELVWATATRDGAQTRLIVRRTVKGAPPRELATTITASDPAERVDAAITPLFAPPGASESPAPVPNLAAAGPPPAATPAAPTLVAQRTPNDDRNTGLIISISGGVGLGLGLALWASYASLQGSIDDHPTRTREDFDELRTLEDRAATRALAGDILVVAGLATLSVGAYYLLRPARGHRVAIAPAPLAHGAGLTLTIVGGL
jgi:hypothetical protein